MIKKFQELVKSKLITRETLARAFGFSKQHVYQLNGWFANLSEETKRLIEEWNFTIVEKTDNWVITVIIEKKCTKN